MVYFHIFIQWKYIVCPEESIDVSLSFLEKNLLKIFHKNETDITVNLIKSVWFSCVSVFVLLTNTNVRIL